MRSRVAAPAAFGLLAAAVVLATGCRSAPSAGVSPSTEAGASGAPTSEARWSDLRTLPVRVLVDQHVGVSDDAVRSLVDVVRSAGTILESAAGIRLLVSEPERLDQPGYGWDVANLVHHLEGRSRDGGDGVVLWFCRSDAVWDVHGRAAGFAQRSIVIAAQRGDGRVRTYPAAIAHEIAHLFGAVHTTSEGSVMRVAASWATRFDAANTAILAATRWIDLGGGAEALDDSVLSRVADLTRDPTLVEGWDPVGWALRRACRDAVTEGDLSGALRCLDRIRAVDPHGSPAADASYYAWLGERAARAGDEAVRDACRAKAEKPRRPRP